MARIYEFNVNLTCTLDQTEAEQVLEEADRLEDAKEDFIDALEQALEEHINSSPPDNTTFSFVEVRKSK